MKVISDIIGKDSSCLLNGLHMSEMAASQRTKEMDFIEVASLKSKKNPKLGN